MKYSIFFLFAAFTFIIHENFIIGFSFSHSNSFHRFYPHSNHISNDLINNKDIHRWKEMKLKVVEHLIDCDANKMISDALGDDLYCLHPKNWLLTDLRGLLNQVVSIGSLVVAYYVIKRSASGVKEWNMIEDENQDEYNEEDDEDYDIPTTSSVPKVRVMKQKSMKKDTCPLCEGTGVFISQTNIRGKCELCQGSGVIERVIPYNLPYNRNKKYFDSDNDENS